MSNFTTSLICANLLNPIMGEHKLRLFMVNEHEIQLNVN